MCGIAGYFGVRELDERAVTRCLELMQHRGPDHGGSVNFTSRTGRNAYLLATRLDIIDLRERSNQPLRVGSKWIAYNGELYNYLEVRNSLESRGRTFATTSDTEVLLTALDEDGTSALDDCEGMWAFAMYDEADGSMLLSRDRFGEKPLWLYRDGSGLYFGSEPAFVFELLGRKGEVLTRAELLEQAWGITADIDTRTVDTHVRRLREALGSYGEAIETVRGFGYRYRVAD